MLHDNLAAKVGASMFAADHASKDLLQMQLVQCQPGRAVMRMAVREEMLNGHRICHGGLIFTLADRRLLSRATAATWRRSLPAPALNSCGRRHWAMC